MDFKDKVVVVTGGAKGIGKIISEECRKAGAKVCIIDMLENDYYTGDIANEKTLVSFSEKVIQEYGRVDCLINNAMVSRGGIDNCLYEDFNCHNDFGWTLYNTNR